MYPDLDGTIATGTDSTLQRAVQALRFLYGTWFRDRTLGMRYLQDTLGQPVNSPLTRAMIKQELEKLVEVDEARVELASVSRTGRELSFSIELDTEEGIVNFIWDEIYGPV